MIAAVGPNPTRPIRCRELEQFQRSIDPWEQQGHEAGRNGDTDLAAGDAEDVADLRAILLTHRDWRTPRGGRGR